MEVHEILQRLGYTKIKDTGPVYRTKPLYRDSGNETILCVFKDTGNFIDHGRDMRGSLAELVRLTLRLESIQEAKKWLGDDSPDFSKYKKKPVFIDQNKIFDDENLEHMIKDHSYWEGRGISKETVSLFLGGVDDGVEGGKFNNRYVFPIIDHVTEEIIGLSGRKLESNSKRPKWIHHGAKSKWLYPLFINEDLLKEKKEIFLVESIGDMLSLWDAGIKNVITLFGINISDAVLFYLIKLSPQRIFISLNNDGDSSKAGNRGAYKILKDLNYYFKERDCRIALPPKNDFNEMSKGEILNWKSEL